MISNKIEEHRTRLGLTQNELAQKIGCSRTTIAKYESGNREPGLEVVRKLANIFNTTTDELLESNFSSISNTTEKMQDQEITNILNMILRLDKRDYSEVCGFIKGLLLNEKYDSKKDMFG